MQLRDLLWYSTNLVPDRKHRNWLDNWSTLQIDYKRSTFRLQEHQFILQSSPLNNIPSTSSWNRYISLVGWIVSGQPPLSLLPFLFWIDHFTETWLVSIDRCWWSLCSWLWPPLFPSIKSPSGSWSRVKNKTLRTANTVSGQYHLSYPAIGIHPDIS